MKIKLMFIIIMLFFCLAANADELIKKEGDMYIYNGKKYGILPSQFMKPGSMEAYEKQDLAASCLIISEMSSIISGLYMLAKVVSAASIPENPHWERVAVGAGIFCTCMGVGYYGAGQQDDAVKIYNKAIEEQKKTGLNILVDDKVLVAWRYSF